MTPTPNKVEAPELLACPFCGGAARSVNCDDSPFGSYVECIAPSGCDATVCALTEVEAITAWNTRTPDERIAGLVSALERIKLWPKTPGRAQEKMDMMVAEANQALATFRETDRG